MAQIRKMEFDGVIVGGVRPARQPDPRAPPPAATGRAPNAASAVLTPARLAHAPAAAQGTPPSEQGVLTPILRAGGANAPAGGGGLARGPPRATRRRRSRGRLQIPRPAPRRGAKSSGSKAARTTPARPTRATPASTLAG